MRPLPNPTGSLFAGYNKALCIIPSASEFCCLSSSTSNTCFSINYGLIKRNLTNFLCFNRAYCKFSCPSPNRFSTNSCTVRYPLQVVTTSADKLQAVTPSASQQLQAVASSVLSLEAASQLQAVASSAPPLQAVNPSAGLQVVQVVHVAPLAAPVQTYPKLSRLEEQNIPKEELPLVRETKTIIMLIGSFTRFV